MYVDTHCHLDSDALAPNLDSILQNCFKQGVNKIIIPGADINDLPKALELSSKFSGVYFALGIHPNEANTFNPSIESRFKECINHKKCVAIGEVGLDYYNLDFKPTKEIQKEVFEIQINLALESKKPLIIHSRESNNDVVDVLKSYENSLKAVVFHCFGGDLNLLGCLKCPIYYGIGGIITFKNAKTLKDSIKKLPLDSILLETDSPYLAPTPFRGKINTPLNIPLINEALALELNLKKEELEKITSANAARVFGFEN